MRVTGFAAVCAAVLLLSGCSAEEKPAGDAAQLASSTGESTQKARSSKISAEATAEDGRKVVVTSSGIYEGANSRFSMVADIGGEKRDLIFADGVLYYHLSDEQVQELKTDKTWVRLTADGNDSLSRTHGKLMAGVVEAMDPTRTIGRIAKAGKVTRSGPTELDGAPVTHYVLELTDGAAPAPAELWVDADRRPAQVTLGGTTVKYRDWAADVVIIAPPPEAVGEPVSR